MTHLLSSHTECTQFNTGGLEDKHVTHLLSSHSSIRKGYIEDKHVTHLLSSHSSKGPERLFRK